MTVPVNEEESPTMLRYELEAVQLCHDPVHRRYHHCVLKVAPPNHVIQSLTLIAKVGELLILELYPIFLTSFRIFGRTQQVLVPPRQCLLLS